ncbi:hypothetical protein SDJN02_12525, partial [Cucurbita argyrosperma subsp. argyrosperma]
KPESTLRNAKKYGNNDLCKERIQAVLDCLCCQVEASVENDDLLKSQNHQKTDLCSLSLVLQCLAMAACKLDRTESLQVELHRWYSSYENRFETTHPRLWLASNNKESRDLSFCHTQINTNNTLQIRIKREAAVISYLLLKINPGFNLNSAYSNPSNFKTPAGKTSETAELDEGKKGDWGKQ